MARWSLRPSANRDPQGKPDPPQRTPARPGDKILFLCDRHGVKRGKREDRRDGGRGRETWASAFGPFAEHTTRHDETRTRKANMKKSMVLKLLLLGVLTLGMASCETPKNYSRSAGWEMQRFDCNGDRVSNYPPYCHPSR